MEENKIICAFVLGKIATASSESSDSDNPYLTSSDEELLILKTRNSHTSVRGYVQTVVPFYDDIDFQSHFRLNRTVTEKLLTDWRLKPISVSVGKPPVEPLHALLLTLWVLANQECFRSVADRFGLSRGHAHQIFIKMVKFISLKKSIYIKWPQGDELRATVNDFNNLRGERSFPNVAGCVDGTHILIPGPRTDDSFFNRKGTNSMILQGICNAKMLFIDIYCGWPGSAHDARVWKNSPIYRKLSNGELLPKHCHLLGDTAYPLDKFILVPFKDNGHLSPEQKKFNVVLSSTRVVIEQSFGRLKGIFRRLKYLNITNLSYFKYIITTACILHNIIIREKLLLDYELSDDMHNSGNEIYEGNVSIGAQNKRNMIMHSL